MPAIDFDRTLERARLGFRRASIFMGFGVNAAGDPKVSNFDLSNETKIQLVQPTEDPEILAGYKSEFRSWVVSNGLRELLEGLVDFLEALHQDCLTLAWSIGRHSPEECDKLQKRFHHAGLQDKFEILQERFSLSSGHVEAILSVNKVRNCYTHRRGRVGQADVGKENKLVVEWEAMDILINRPGEDPINIRDLPEGGLATPDGGTVEAKKVLRCLEFELGSHVKLSATDLAEFCFLANQAAAELASCAVEFAKTIGIEVRDRENGS